MDADLNFYFGGPIFNLDVSSKQEIYLRKINFSGITIYEKKFGAPSYDDELHALAVTSNGTVIIGGFFQNTVDFDTSPTAVANRFSVRSNSSFIASYASNGAYKWASIIEDNTGSKRFRCAGKKSIKMTVGKMHRK